MSEILKPVLELFGIGYDYENEPQTKIRCKTCGLEGEWNIPCKRCGSIAKHFKKGGER